jgi:hypothetical protein
MNEIFIAPIKKPRENWKAQFEKAAGTNQPLNEEEQEWIDALLVDENIVDCTQGMFQI